MESSTASAAAIALGAWSSDPAEAVVELTSPPGWSELLKRPPWMADAACREHPGINWFPGQNDRSAPAKAICARCLVRQQCLDYALAVPRTVGIWGGMSVRERNRLRTRRLAAAAEPAAEC